MSFFISSDGARLHYTDKGRGRAVILVSGYSTISKIIYVSPAPPRFALQNGERYPPCLTG